jgi:hypothetical protein|tara:strand:- start:2648 stop:3265 length:618 start_codon:yes stop_codon:yes gene_type:complete
MAVGDTDVTICSAALLLLGESEISSFDDGTQISGACSTLYGGVKNSILSLYPWSFAMKKVQLAELTSTPVNEWQREFALPAEMITGTPQAVYSSTAVGATPQQTGWEILGNAIQTDFTTVVIDYIFSVPEAMMPTHFVQLLKYAMAAHLAEIVTDQIDKADYWRTVAFGRGDENGRGGFFRQSININGRGQIPNQVLTFPLTDVR